MATLRVVAIMLLLPLEKWVFEKHISQWLLLHGWHLERHLPHLCEVECLWETWTIRHVKFATHDWLVGNKPNGHKIGFWAEKKKMKTIDLELKPFFLG